MTNDDGGWAPASSFVATAPHFRQIFEPLV
jgi:hypothetical protein